MPDFTQPAADGNRQIVDRSGMPVSRSLPTIEVARAVVQEMEKVEEPTAIRHARLRGLADRNPPYNQKKLDDLNMGNITNIDFGEAQAAIRKRSGQHFELFQEVPTLADFELVEPPDEAKNGQDVQPRAALESIVGEEFTRTLTGWSGFLPLMDFLRQEADTVDVGVCGWRDQWDWRPVQTSRGAFFPSPYAKIDVTTWDIAMVADTYETSVLLAIASDPESATAEGWNVTMLKRVLADVFFGGVTQDTQNGVDTGYATVSRWEQLQMKLRNNDPSCMANMFSLVKVRHMFVREPMSGRISHQILPTVVCGEGDGFLCERFGIYKDMSEAIFILPSNYGNGYVRSVRGLLSSIEAHCDLSNRFLGRIMDAGFLSGTLMLKNNAEYSDPRKLQLVRAGSVTLLPRGCEALQASSFAPPLAPMVQVRQLSTAIMQNNNGVDKVVTENWVENQAQRTAREVSEQSTKEARVEKSGVAFDQQQLQLLYRQMYRRLIGEDVQSDKTLPGAEEAQDFVRRCVRRGVPRTWLKPGKLQLNITRTIGFGSWGVRLDISNQVIGMRGLMDEAGRHNAIRDRLAALVGYRNVNRYLPPATRDTIPSNEKSIARLENNDMAAGEPCEAGSDQNQVLHFETHLEPMKMISDAVANGEQVDVQIALPAIEQMINHETQHLQFLAMDPARAAYVKQAEEQIKAAIKARDELVRIAEQMAEEQQQMQADQEGRLAKADEIIQGQEANLEAQKAAGKLQIEADKNLSIMNMRQSRQEHGEAMAERDLNARIVRQDRESAARIELERQNLALKAEIERMKAAQGGGSNG
jgi:hypothetical protein